MNKGWYAPYDLSLRTWMGGRTHRLWIRKQFELQAPGGMFWTGPASAMMTTTPPYTVERVPALEASEKQFVMATFVETIALGDVYLGFAAEVFESGTVVRFWDQVWLAGVPQMQEEGQRYTPGSLVGWSSFGVGHLLEPGADLGSSPVTYQAIAYPP